MSFLQTLAAAFKGGGSRVPLARNFSSPWFFAEGSARAPFEYNGAVKRAYLDNPVAQRAVRLVAEGIGGAPLKPADPALLGLVRATSGGQALLETLASHLLLHGNAYVQVIKDALGAPVELYALRPERISVVAGSVRCTSHGPTPSAMRLSRKYRHCCCRLQRRRSLPASVLRWICRGKSPASSERRRHGHPSPASCSSWD